MPASLVYDGLYYLRNRIVFYLRSAPGKHAGTYLVKECTVIRGSLLLPEADATPYARRAPLL